MSTNKLTLRLSSKILDLMKYFLGLMIIFWALGCDDSSVKVDKDLIPYFDKFKEEAAKRGIAFDYKEAQISGEITTAESRIIGQCIHLENSPSIVRLNFAYWIKSSEEEREFYVFHELGHCFLKRSHLNSSDKQGLCVSLMHADPTVCKFTYDKSTRDKYITELFTK